MLCATCEYHRFRRCNVYKKATQITNADKIRSMTDEELAEMFLKREGTERHINPRRDFLPLFYAPDGTCCRDRNYALQLWIDWLKQPAEED